MQNLSLHSLPWLTYDVRLIKERLINFPETEYFVFSPYLGGHHGSVGLVAFSYQRTPSPVYSSTFDILTPDNSRRVELSQPVVMGNNVLPVTTIKKLIEANSVALTFVPAVRDNKYLYYNVQADGLGSPSESDYKTNPCPPATII